MGCCCSTEDGTGSDAGEPNARTPLLGDAPAPASGGAPGGEAVCEPPVRPGEARARGDGETQLDGILQDMAGAVIDVAAVDTQNLEQQDYVERCRYYAAAVARLSALPAPPRAIEDVPHPERLLAAPPARSEDVRLARALAQDVHDATKAIQVVPHESLVIPFGQTAGGDAS